MKHYLRLLLAAGFGAISIGASAAAVHDWTATRIGEFDAGALQIADMNNAGQVAMWSGPRGGPGPDTRRGFLYTPGSSGGLVDLGTFGGIAVPKALNESGQLVGFWSTADVPKAHAFIYQNGRMQHLSLPGEMSAAVDINDRGQVLVAFQGADSVPRAAIFHPAGPPTVLSAPAEVFPVGGINNRGQAFGQLGLTDPTQSQRSFFYDNGRMIDIGTLGGNTNAYDMNASGQIVGSSAGQPFLYSDGKMTAISNAGQAVDINDRGQVLFGGSIYSDGQVHELRDVDGGPTIPLHVNELGQVVGISNLLSDDGHFFFYSDGTTTDLTQWLRTSFSDVTAGSSLQLNDLGQIAIAATLTNGRQTLFVLTPIPEPWTYALMLAGLGTLAWIARRQRGRSMGTRVDQTHQTGLAA